jgi:hypothetical protein
MKVVKRRAVCLFVMSVSAASCARAQAQAVQADIKAFVAQYVAAFNARDVARIHALYHPKSLACIRKRWPP